MTALKYWDTGSSSWKILSGPPGPTVVSADANNLARLGSDNYLYAPSTAVGRNLFHNSMFRVQQRGAGPWNTNGVYTFDRWVMQLTLDTYQVNVGVATDGGRASIGDEEHSFYLQNVVTGNAGATALSRLVQRVEGVRRLSGKTVTISFWWHTPTAGLKLGVSTIQNFGTGGSPSGTVSGGNIATFTAPDNNWHRYSCTTTLPSVSGMTTGTNGDDTTIFCFWLSSGANSGTVAGTGVQTGTFNLWGMQLEIGTQATPLEKLDIAVDRTECMRFYQILRHVGVNGWAGSASVALGYGLVFPVTMRANPVATPSGISYGNAASLGIDSSTALGTGAFIWATSVASGAVTWSADIAFSADL